MLIFPTKYEHECFPVVILEAMKFGIPTVTYNTAAIKDILKRDYLGYVSENNNYYDLVNEIQKRINNKIDYEKIRDNFKRNYLLRDASKKLKVILLNCQGPGHR